MKKAFIFHGTEDAPHSHWFERLKRELEKKECMVHTLQFPGIREESYESWKGVLLPYIHEIDENTLFIGHSLWACFALSLLSQENLHIHACYLIWAWWEKFSEEVIEKQYQKFVELWYTDDKKYLYHYESFIKNLDFWTIKKHCPVFYIFASANDPYIPVEMARNLQEELWAQYFEYPHAGHFCKKDGYKTFEDLKSEIFKNV